VDHAEQPPERDSHAVAVRALVRAHDPVGPLRRRHLISGGDAAGGPPSRAGVRLALRDRVGHMHVAARSGRRREAVAGQRAPALLAAPARQPVQTRPCPQRLRRLRPPVEPQQEVLHPHDGLRRRAHPLRHRAQHRHARQCAIGHRQFRRAASHFGGAASGPAGVGESEHPQVRPSTRPAGLP